MFQFLLDSADISFSITIPFQSLLTYSIGTEEDEELELRGRVASGEGKVLAPKLQLKVDIGVYAVKLCRFHLIQANVEIVEIQFLKSN